MLSKMKYAGVALALAASATVMIAPSAEAHRRGGRAPAIVAGTIIGLGILGAYAHERDRGHYYQRSCYPGRKRCEVVGQRCWYTRYGEYVCKDDVRCHRPTHCD